MHIRLPSIQRKYFAKRPTSAKSREKLIEKPGIAIHGSFRDHDPEGAKNIKGKVQILHGAEDTVAPLAEVAKVIDALRKVKVEFHYELYSGLPNC